MFRILFVDDEPENVEFVCNTVRDALDADVVLATTVKTRGNAVAQVCSAARTVRQ